MHMCVDEQAVFTKLYELQTFLSMKDNTTSTEAAA